MLRPWWLMFSGRVKAWTGVRLVDRDITWSRAYSPILQGLMKQNLGIESILETHPKTIVFEKFQKGEFDIAVQCDSQSLPVLEDYWGLVSGQKALRTGASGRTTSSTSSTWKSWGRCQALTRML